MAELLRYYVSEDSIFLHLEHVKGKTALYPLSSSRLNWHRFCGYSGPTWIVLHKRFHLKGHVHQIGLGDPNTKGALDFGTRPLIDQEKIVQDGNCNSRASLVSSTD